MSPPAAAAAGTVTPHRTKLPTRPVGPTRPRRISGPVRPVRPGVRDGSRQPAPRSLVLRVGALVGAASRHRLLDRLIAGKAWIAVVAFALIGIVTLQLGLLELNRGIGRSLERQGTLQRENATLSVENSELAAGGRVESRAQSQGMELVSPGALRFLGSDPRGDIGKAAAALNVPVHSIDLGGEGSASSTSAASASTGSSSSEQASTATEAGSATSPGPSQGEASATTSSAPASESAAGAPPSGEGAAGAAASEGAAAPASTPGPARTSSEQSSAGAGEAAEATSAGGAQASPSG